MIVSDSIKAIKVETKEAEPIIIVQDAYKRYTSNSVILQGLSMNVSKGTIYSLLGPSGCGKTTLLSCLTGRKSLDAGYIKVNLKSELLLGYMPQEISLYEDLCIHEIFMYFGLLMNKSKSYIFAREKELTELLELPPSGRVVESLSGGQQRRVSMAVALLHDPELLILDEPTAGVDPLLAHNIWLYFIKITNEDHKTIIITTHYIEEAKNSHVIGLMRGGLMLAEMNPKTLMRSMNCSTLEEAFLILSQKQEERPMNPKVITLITIDFPKSQVKTDIPFMTKKIFAGYRLKAQLYKDIKWTMKNVPITLLVLALPSVLFIIFMGILSGNVDYINLAVVSDELTPGVDDCNVTNKIVSEYGCVTDIRLSCKLISYLRNKSHKVIEFENMEDGITAVKKNKAWALLYFHKNYTEGALVRLDKGRSAPDDMIDRSILDVYSDNTIYFIAVALRRNLIINMRTCMEVFFESCQASKKLALIPAIRSQPPVYESYELKYSSLNGYIISILFYLAYVYTSTSVIYEKNNGLLDRTAISGMTTLELVLAHSCVQILVSTLQNLTVYLIVYKVFLLKLNTSFMIILTLYFVAELSGMTVGFLVVEFVTLEVLVTYVGITIVITLFFSIGMLWPSEGIHWSLKMFNKLNPLKKAVVTYNSLQFRDLPFSNPQIYEGYLYLFLLFVFSSVLWWLKTRNN